MAMYDYASSLYKAYGNYDAFLTQGLDVSVTHINYNVNKNIDTDIIKRDMAAYLKESTIDSDSSKVLKGSGIDKASSSDNVQTKKSSDSATVPSKQNSACSVELSKEAQIYAENNASTANTTEATQPYKYAGTTSTREAWENESARFKNNYNHDHLGNYQISESEMLRMSDPELYSKIMDLEDQARRSVMHLDACVELPHEEGAADIEYKYYYNISQKEFDELKKQGKVFGGYSFDWSESARKRANELYNEAFQLKRQWRIDNTDKVANRFNNPVSKQFTALDFLEALHSDDKHQTSFNFYGKGLDEHPHNIYTGASMWRFSTKFNVLISNDALSIIANGDSKWASSIMEDINTAVGNMKKIEKAYEGNAVYLRFGARIDDNGSITYHANFKDCEDKYGISADTPDQLLEKLMSYNK
ncbi:DUF6033 family protein [Butyrivibrio sp. VCD2006]|uniref:DUF6033 family protein n=1 Tax=Butyrivibrio sp. VCD2006 TaxID=1280664 RepID=UPI0004083369|nr:DUF6033 family protein [Butyrivibrio sp. VCD2006]